MLGINESDRLMSNQKQNITMTVLQHGDNFIGMKIAQYNPI